MCDENQVQHLKALGATDADVEQAKALNFDFAKWLPVILNFLKLLQDSGILSGGGGVPFSQAAGQAAPGQPAKAAKPAKQ